MPYNINMEIKRIRLILLIFWLILAGLIVWFKIVPNGQMTYLVSYPNKINIFGGKGFIGNLTPSDRVINKPGQMVEITGDPVYFSVFTPRTFSEAKVTITYQDNLTTSTPIIEAGVLVDNIVWRYKLASLQNKILDSNFNNWYKVRSGDILLLQKDNNFSSVDEFLSTLKNKPQAICKKDVKYCLAVYNMDDISSGYNLESYNSFQKINIPLKGAHQFYFTVSGGKELKFDFDFADLNLDKKSDPIVISIYKDESKIYSTVIDDNFGDDGSGVVRNIFVPLSYASVSSTTSLYKLEIKVSDDIVIKKISKAPSALNVIGKIHPVTVSSLPLYFWTDSSFIKLTTNNPASRQNIRYGNKDFSLPEPYQQFEFLNNEPGLKKVTLNKDDVILETDGVFSFTPDNFSNPDLQKVGEHFSLTADTNYILAKYDSPKIINDNFKQATVILNTKEAYRENGKYSFMISVPGLSLAKSGNLKISNIKIEFYGRSIFDKIKEKFGIYDNKN
jgi:hypothetical protein